MEVVKSTKYVTEGINKTFGPTDQKWKGKEMMMTEDEICYRYRINGCYGEKHISILAQLNACSIKEIDMILRKHGLIPKPAKYRKKRKSA